MLFFRNHEFAFLHQPEERDPRQNLHALQRHHAVVTGKGQLFLNCLFPNHSNNFVRSFLIDSTIK